MDALLVPQTLHVWHIVTYIDLSKPPLGRVQGTMYGSVWVLQAEFASIDIDMEDADLIYALKSIVMAVKPWIPRGQEGSFTDEISTEHPVFQPLVSACLGTVVAK